jgi:hypothetical protein
MLQQEQQLLGHVLSLAKGKDFSGGKDRIAIEQNALQVLVESTHRLGEMQARDDWPTASSQQKPFPGGVRVLGKGHAGNVSPKRPPRKVGELSRANVAPKDARGLRRWLRGHKRP